MGLDGDFMGLLTNATSYTQYMKIYRSQLEDIDPAA